MSAPGSATSGLGIASSYTLGESAYAVGHPQLEPLSVSSGELSAEIIVQIVVGMNVEAKDCSGNTYELITDLPPMMKFFGVNNVCIRKLPANTSSIVISPGNSGSPVVNIYGNIVAIVFAANQSGTRSYHVPLRDVKEFLNNL